jgi:UDP-N-acetylmuramyl pentapeptide phosphotransferase/UDP-N-acetylglucosamine-1-phosphate transferase
MGDAGSVPLGFMAAALGAVGTRDGVWPGWFMPLVFAPFILDASVTLLRRALRGERLAQAHREHYYQRAALLGVSRRALFGASVAIMGVTAALALGVRAGLDSAGLGLAVWGSVVMLGMGWIDARWRQRDGGAR